jgi:hypothetical protein
MENVSQLEIRERYMQLSRKMLIATEEGRPEEELQQIHQQLKELEPEICRIENFNAPDCP